MALRATFLEKIVYSSLERAGRQNLLQSGEEHHVVDLLIAELMQHYDGCNGRKCETP
jgi:hypothetical protein